MIFYQDQNGYCYNSDTIFLYYFIKKFLKKNRSILDVGCGYGVLGLLLARDFSLRLSMIDIQENNVFLSRKNSETASIDSEVFLGDFRAFEFTQSFEYIVCNPPFYCEGSLKSENPSINKSRYEEHLPIEALIEKSAKLLAKNGELYLCYDSKKLHRLVMALEKQKLGITDIRFLHPKVGRKSTIFFVRAKRGVKSNITLQAPFIVFDENSEYTSEAKEAFLSASTHSIKCELR